VGAIFWQGEAPMSWWYILGLWAVAAVLVSLMLGRMIALFAKDRPRMLLEGRTVRAKRAVRQYGMPD
jgi:hypothetical protein